MKNYIQICLLSIISFGLFAQNNGLIDEQKENTTIHVELATYTENAAPAAGTFSIFDLSSWTADRHISWWWLLLAAFLAGVLISFTPCVYPMVPVTAAIMQNYASESLIKQFFNALFYVVGIALVYAIFGYFSALYGVLFGSWMSSPAMLGLIVSFYIYCAGAMFDFYELYLPSFFLKKDAGFSKQSSMFSIFLYGMLTGTFASPCITPGLSLILGIVTQLKNPLLGFMMLFVFGIGMSFLLLLVSISTKALVFLPQSGIWMLEIKKVFGLLLLIVAFSYVTHLLSEQAILLSQLFFFFSVIFFYGIKTISLFSQGLSKFDSWGLLFLYSSIIGASGLRIYTLLFGA